MLSRYYPFLFLLFACNYRQASFQDRDSANNFKIEKDWLKLPVDYKLGSPSGISIDTSQHLFIFHRAGREWELFGSMPDTFISAKTILEVDSAGTIINSWGDHLFLMPHGLTIDKDNNVWLTDVGLHQVFKFSHEGRLLMKLGEAKVAGNDKAHFNMPTDVAVANDGSFYVSDGYGNSRVIKFSPEGKYLFEWGSHGDKEGEFDVPHSITLDNIGNVYVADRENKRIEVFDSTGRFIRQWKNESFGRIFSVIFNEMQEGFVAVDDATSFFKIKHNGSDIIVLNTAGRVIKKFGKDELKKDNITCWYHDVAMDKQGNIYVADILGNKVQKFKKVSPDLEQ